jgi:hypothetical protein
VNLCCSNLASRAVREDCGGKVAAASSRNRVVVSRITKSMKCGGTGRHEKPSRKPTIPSQGVRYGSEGCRFDSCRAHRAKVQGGRGAPVRYASAPLASGLLTGLVVWGRGPRRRRGPPAVAEGSAAPIKVLLRALIHQIRVHNREAIHPIFRVPVGVDLAGDDAVRAPSRSVGAEGLEPPTCWL